MIFINKGRFAAVVFVAAFVFVLIAAVPGTARALAPLTTYNATTSQAYLPVPAVPPALNAAPFVFHDANPAFASTRMLRVTDGNTAVTSADNSPQNRSFYTYAGNGNAFGADDAHFIGRMSGGAFYLFNFDPVNFTASIAKDGAGNSILLPFGNANFSYSDPNIIYGTDWSGFKFDQYNIATGQATQLFDLTTAIRPPAGTYMGDMQVANGYLVADFGGPQQDQMPYVLSYNLATGNYILLNLASSTVYNSATHATVPAELNVSGTLYGFSGYNAGVHSVAIDHSGRYVLVTVHSSMPGNGFDVWDTQGNTIINALENAHDDLGYGYSAGGDGNYSDSFILHNLGTANVSTPIQLNPDATGWYFGSHFSWSNSSALTPLAPLFDDTLVDDGYPPGQSPWQKEIIAVCTSCSTFTVWRFADNYMEYDTANPLTDSFWDQARGNVSQDGRYYLFDSNWDYGLGTDPYSHYPRHDLFVVDLASASGYSSSAPVIASAASSTSSSPAASSPVGVVSSTANSYFINAGGSAYTGSTGQYWIADADYINGWYNSSNAGIAGTGDPALYQTQRYGGSFAYNFPVASGTYSVTLKFAELTQNSIGARVMNIAINGSMVLNNFDIYAQAGMNTALDKTFTVSAGNQISIQFTGTVGNAVVNAISVVPVINTFISSVAASSSATSTNTSPVPVSSSTPVSLPAPAPIFTTPSSQPMASGVSGGGSSAAPISTALLNLVAQPSDTSVILTWNTNNLATTGVRAGQNALAYSLSSSSNAFVTAHSITLSGLVPGTTYHYQAYSSDQDGFTIFSPDSTFTTSLAPAAGQSSSLSSSPSSELSLLNSLIARLHALVHQAEMQGISIPAGANAYLMATGTSATGTPSLPVVVSPSAFAFSRNLSMEDTGPDVRALQQYLISQNTGSAARALAAVGPTQYFGAFTYRALIEFQMAHQISPASGYFGPITRAWIEGRQ
ncbi:MAG: peptidoglycan-binding protein [Patescibacteria group bacterium]|nr:peptidoglycan-binding protein [Patescibacteria group bacterium]